ncbi:MAG: YlxR family protein [Dehalococcoidia bacterium]|nr:YlxR family protein [Dehalococcoidia bacterium]
MKTKHVPLRTCVGCRQVRPKRELVRIVQGPDGQLTLDETGKQDGRGAYVCPDPECWEATFKRERLDKALHSKVPKEEHAVLLERLGSLSKAKA